MKNIKLEIPSKQRSIETCMATGANLIILALAAVQVEENE